MDRRTALSAAGAVTMTAAAAVSALFLTVDRGAKASEGVPSSPVVVTEFQVLPLEQLGTPEPVPLDTGAAAATEPDMDGGAYHDHGARHEHEEAHDESEYEDDDHEGEETDDYEDDEHESDDADEDDHDER